MEKEQYCTWSISDIVNFENWTLDDYIDNMSKAQKNWQDTINAVNELDESLKSEERQNS
ncbi:MULTISPECIES: T7SS effector LXG polymorphic toxin [Bacillus]|uniref:T7SS effector LXG polymorphic toxin n=1 Tax=Bacillus TaxID=1386 RepID=UPI0022A9A00E|nr:T7SS effector LXG polymorphic toxin [Bacillus glycinifermentans]MED8019762.1 T7SS effector LXG polymorphic toxin [Bacillus glycinifermentans]